MHAVNRTEPSRITRIRNRYLFGDRKWMHENGSWELHPDDYIAVISALQQEFNSICAYCERKCDRRSNQVDHFRPRERASSRSLDWCNLVYSCKECNTQKANNWPTFGLVNPNCMPNRIPAQDFFAYSIDTGRIRVADWLLKDHRHYKERSMARDTIKYLNLNSEKKFAVDKYSPINLPRLRVDALHEFDRKLMGSNNREELWDCLLMRKEPFSSFIIAHYMTPNR